MLRVVVAGIGPDGDGRPTDPVVRALRDEGHEVVATGSDQSPEQVVATALQEDADLVVLWVGTVSAAADHDRVAALLVDQAAADVGVLVTGPASTGGRALASGTWVVPGEVAGWVTRWVAG